MNDYGTDQIKGSIHEYFADTSRPRSATKVGLELISEEIAMLLNTLGDDDEEDD